MSLVSSNPQDLAVEALVEFFQSDTKGRIALYPASSDRDYSAATSTGAGPLDFRILSFGEIVDCLAEAGLLVTPQASSAERSEEDLVSAIAESLRDFHVSAGGMLLSLTETERRRIGWTVRGVCQQVVRDE